MRSDLIGILAISALFIAVVAGGAQPSLAAGSTASVQVAQTSSSTSTPAEANSTPDATVKLSGGEVALGIGYSWGHGTVTYDGMPHPFNISGLSIVNVGATSVSAVGDVYHLKKLQDFAGTYAAFSAGATFGGGGSITWLRNENGVVIKLTSTTEGLNFKLSGNGVKVTLG
jgi:hypothetical protein